METQQLFTIVDFLRIRDFNAGNAALAITQAEVAITLYELHFDELDRQLPEALQFDARRLTALFDRLVRLFPDVTDPAVRAALTDVLYRLHWAAAPSVGRPDEAREAACHRATWALLDEWHHQGSPLNGSFAARLALCLAAHLSPDPSWDGEVRDAQFRLLGHWAATQSPDGTWPQLPHAEAALRAEALRRNEEWLLDDRYAAATRRADARYPQPEASDVEQQARRLVLTVREAAEERLCV